MPGPAELAGRPAAPGIAAGPLFRLDAAVAGRRPTGDPIAERAALAAAVAQSADQVAALMLGADDEGEAILEFQVAMLSDEALTEPAFLEIDRGATAEAAWLSTMGEQIEGYEAADDEYFRARAADIADLRDRVLRNLSASEADAAPPGAILVGDELTPSRFLETDWAKGGGIALSAGSATSHVAMLARSRGVPMVVGLGPIVLDGHAEGVVDGEAGTLALSPGAAERAAIEARRAARVGAMAEAARHLLDSAATADGTRIRVMANVARPEEVDAIDVAACDGIGLMRTEFLFAGDRLPDEETQYRAYAKVLDWARGRPVTIRTCDAGGDKPVAGLTVAEPNPFLGLRGLRLSLRRPDVFGTQLRALVRAAAHGDLKIMLPMVTVPEEIEAARAHLDAAAASIGSPASPPPLGIMVEVPAVAILPERYRAAAFFSIGSNDLTQYVTAAARDSSHVADLCDVRNPAVMRLIESVVRFGREADMETSICGDAAGDPGLVPALLAAGLRSLSVAPAALGAVKAAIARVCLDA